MIAILVPVLGRPRRARPLVTNIRKMTSVEHRILFLCSPGDDAEIAAVLKTSADFIVVDWAPGPGDFARKINYGYRLTQEPFIQIGADDLVFHRGWDTAALILAEETGMGVIGTNDLHNPRVVSGRHSTHPLIRRSYIEEQGGTVDHTGDIFSEGYDHQYVDDELVLTAKMRGQWAFAEHSHVEHKHPYFGLAKVDDTYRKALQETRADHRLFVRRQRLVKNAIRRERSRV